MGGALAWKVFTKFLADYWQFIVVIVLGVIIFFYWNHRTTLIEEQQSQITQYVVDKATLEERFKKEKQQLIDRIEEQNTAIAAFQKQSVQNQATINAAKNEVIKIQSYYNTEIRKILSGAKPEDCQSAIKYLVDAAGEFSKKEKVNK